jgi:peptide/nickel transport system substrate-binding protein
MKKSFVVFASILLALGAGCSGGKTVENEKIIQYGIPTEPDHLDPYEATSADSRFIFFNLFEGLLKPAPDGRLVPAAASSYAASEDFLTWTIKLKPSVYFHNGNRVTAADVRYSLTRAAEKKLNGMESVLSVQEIDESTIVITLSQGDPEFYYYLTYAVIPEGYEKQNEFPIGTGPFKFVSFTPQYELVLQRHDKYWNAELPRIDRLVFKIKADYNSVMLDLRAGSLEAGTVDNTSVLQLPQNDFNIIYETINAPQIFCLNNSYKPLSDARVRKAISYVVDADEIMSLVHNGFAKRASSPVIPALLYAYNGENDNLYKKNIEKAKALLAEAGYGAGFSLEIAAPVNYQPHVDAAQVIVNQLSQIGIKAAIRQVDWGSWIENVYMGREYQATVIGIDGATLSPRSYLFRYESASPHNFINYKNAEYDALYKQTLDMADEGSRTAAYKRLQQILIDDAASVFLCDLSAPRVFKKNITGFQGYPLYVFDASTLKIE